MVISDSRQILGNGNHFNKKLNLVEDMGFFDSDRIITDLLYPWMKKRLNEGDYVIINQKTPDSSS